MAQHDIYQQRSVTQVVPENTGGAPVPHDMERSVAQIGQEIIRRGQEAKLTENFSSAQLELNALDSEYKLRNEGDPFNEKAFGDYKKQRDAIVKNYGDGISPFFRGSWDQNARKLITQNDATMQTWGLAQTQKNAVLSINNSIKNNMLQASADGKAFAQSDGLVVENVLNYRTAKEQLVGYAEKNVGHEQATGLLENYDRDYLKSFVAGTASVNPQKARKLLEEKDIKSKLTAEEIDTFSNVIDRQEKKHTVERLASQVGTSDAVAARSMDQDKNYFDQILEIDEAEAAGKITTKTATQARRVLRSREAVDAVTSAPIMADVVSQIYDLNAIQDTNSQDYLVGVQNIRDDILRLQADGKLGASDAQKLNGQLSTLTSAKMADATKAVGQEFSEANDMFKQLPPQYRGQATRELFYKVQENPNSKPADQKHFANQIVDGINGKIRQKTVAKLQGMSLSDDDVLKKFSYTMDDVRETAKIYGTTEAEVIQQLRVK